MSENSSVSVDLYTNYSEKLAQIILDCSKYGAGGLLKLSKDSITKIEYISRNLCYDSVMVRAFASEAEGAGSNPGRVIPKTLKMVPVATLLGAQH